jgi:acetylornithine aminotransferase/acetylornithine/N-succinyldiaminopimelate aminotransferase
MAKGLGGGFPIGAIWVSEKAADLFHPGQHGTTFGGTPLACAAALAVLDVIEKDKLVDHVAKTSAPFIAQLQALARQFPNHIKAVRGKGFLVGLEMASDPASYVALFREHGLLVPSAGGNVVRLLPPLNVSSQELDKCLEIITKCLASKA